MGILSSLMAAWELRRIVRQEQTRRLAAEDMSGQHDQLQEIVYLVQNFVYDRPAMKSALGRLNSDKRGAA